MVRSPGYHALLLPVVLLTKKMALLVGHGIGVLDAPQALGGLLVTVLVLSPEGMAAVRAPLANRLSRTMSPKAP